MNKCCTVWRVNDLVESCQSIQTEIDGIWIPARPEGYSSVLYRIKCAWLVFSGKADVVVWEKQ